MSWNQGGDDAWNEGGGDNNDQWNEGHQDGGDTGCDVTQGNDDNFGGNAGGNDNACRNCGNTGHFARECPEPRKPSGACFNCGEDGHNKAECTKPRVFKGTCRICEKEGHPASECPDKAPDICKNCKVEGHKTMDCTENRKLEQHHIPDKIPEEAWAILKKASNERDLEDFRDGLKIYSKAVPMATYQDIEKKLREEKLGIYIIGLEREVGDCHSLVNLQGKLNCKYVVGFYFNEKPQRASLKERWPESVEDNLKRLEEAGFPLDRQIPKCNNCGQMGHTGRGCKEERTVIERVEVKCVNCKQPGHRARDCTEERRDKFACRNCGKPDHRAAECPEPRSAEGVECKKCNEVGHFAKDCPQGGGSRACRNCGEEGHMSKECDQPRNMSTVTCRNCEEVGHFSRDCTKKKDWSKVKCNNCGEMGHTIKRCNKPVEGGNDNGDVGGYNNNTSFDDNVAGPESTTQPEGAWASNEGGSGW